MSNTTFEPPEPHMTPFTPEQFSGEVNTGVVLVIVAIIAIIIFAFLYFYLKEET